MEASRRLRWLRIALVVSGVACAATWPLMVLFPAGFSWHPRGSHSEYMIVAIYAVLGVFLLIASKDPLSHRSLIWFAVWSSVAHGGLMAWQAITDPTERAHMAGDVPALLVAALVVGLLMPRRSAAEAGSEARRAA